MADLQKHFEYMSLATFVAYRALKNGETPVACVFVHRKTGEILSFGCNDTNRSLNGTRHAEFLGIDYILEKHRLLGAPMEVIREFFTDVVLYVTIEPCVMCASALRQMGIGRVYFGAANDRFGGNGTVIKIQGDHSYQSIGGIMRVEAVHLLRSFYIQENESAPVPKVKKNKDIEGKEFPRNLKFPEYISREVFVEVFGEERCAKFFMDHGADAEITPRIGHGYSILDLLTDRLIQGIPELRELYPKGEPTILEDIEELGHMLPSVGATGEVCQENRKRKLED